jgi:hypothetical protein
MTLKLITAVLVAGIAFGSTGARAHCDSVDGPVAKAALTALDDGNVYPVLAYAPAAAEDEIRAAFERSRKVRVLAGDARELADRAFLETVIRLHRAGEGAAYTGLKPAGIDYGPAIPAAEKAVKTGDITALRAVLVEAVEHALTERLAHVRELKGVSLDAKTAAEVPHARERVGAELGFVTFAETLRQAALGRGAEHHTD